jgi:hypothetical protein
MAEDAVGDLVKHLTPAQAAPQPPVKPAPVQTPPPAAAAPPPPAISAAAPPPATPDANSSSLDWAKYYLDPSSYTGAYAPTTYSSAPSAQQVSDFATVAGSNFPIKPAVQRFGADVLGIGARPDFVKLRADTEAARQRLGSGASLAADAVGAYTNPTTPLNFVPLIGPGLAGGIQQGVKSYGEGGSAPAVVGNTVAGATEGELSLGAAKLLSNPQVMKTAAKGAAYMAPTGIASLLGLHSGYPLEGAGVGGILSLLGGKESLLERFADKAGQVGAWAAGKVPTRTVQMGLSGVYPVLGRGGYYGEPPTAPPRP